MVEFKALVPGGFFSKDPYDKKVPVSIRTNNAGAVNGAAWEQEMPGYVGTDETTPGNKTTIFSAPEYGIAVWWELLRRYRDSGANTVGSIVKRYGGGQDYSAYVRMVMKWTGFKENQVIDLEDDGVLLPFAKAMFRYESGVVPPWSDEQIIYGFNLGRKKKAPPPTAAEDGIPPWLKTMREITGTDEYPGGADNPVIMGWRDEIAAKFPDMKSYCANYTHDSIPWCGLTVAYCMAHNGIRPVFGDGDLNKFLWADAWARFGTKLDKPKLGCVMVFTRNGGGHVAMYEGEEPGYYLIRGGNQSDSVNVTRMSKSKFTAAVWPKQQPAIKPEIAAGVVVVAAGGGVTAAAKPVLDGIALSAVIAGVAILAIASFLFVRYLRSD